jgi:hypothetical protein
MKIVRNIIALVWILILAVGIAKNDPLHIGHLLSVIIIFPVLYWGHDVWLESYLRQHALVMRQDSLPAGLYVIVSNDVFEHSGQGLILELVPAVMGRYGFVERSSASSVNYFIHTYNPGVEKLAQNACIEVSKTGEVSMYSVFKQ